MTVSRYVRIAPTAVVTLVLLGSANAATLPKHTSLRVSGTVHFVDDWQGETGYIRVAGLGAATTSASATIRSEAGTESVTLLESDAWLHGAAALKALPAADATVTLTLYDSGSASLMSFSGKVRGKYGGVVDRDGNLWTLTADSGSSESTDCASRAGCTSETERATLDVEVLSAELFPAGSGYELVVDLAGADTAEVAYGSVSITEGKSTTAAEVGWEAFGTIWQGDLTTPLEGAVETRVQSNDAEGKKVDSLKLQAGRPWMDGDEGVGVLATDEDPLTSLGVFAHYTSDMYAAGHVRTPRIAVASEGWTSTTVPVAARLELTGGGTLTVPVNSYQRSGLASWSRTGDLAILSGLARGSRLVVAAGSSTVYDSSVTELGEPSCAGGACVTLIENGTDGYDLSVTGYGADAAKLEDELTLTASMFDAAGVKEWAETATVNLGDEVTATFVNDVSFSSEPFGLDLAGKVSLLAAADKKGKQATLAKGTFQGSFARDAAGRPVLAAVDKQGASSRGDLVNAGSAVSFETTTDTNKDGRINAPPIVATIGGDGAIGVRLTAPVFHF